MSFHLIRNMPILLAIIILAILEVWRSIKVIRGLFRVMRGQFMFMISHKIQNSKSLSNIMS